MADKKFTLLELHLGDGTVQIGPATIGDEQNAITEPESKDSDESERNEGGCGCPGRTAGKLLVVLLVVALLALGLKKALGGGEELADLEALDEDEDEA